METSQVWDCLFLLTGKGLECSCMLEWVFFGGGRSCLFPFFFSPVLHVESSGLLTFSTMVQSLRICVGSFDSCTCSALFFWSRG